MINGKPGQSKTPGSVVFFFLQTYSNYLHFLSQVQAVKQNTHTHPRKYPFALPLLLEPLSDREAPVHEKSAELC